MAGLQRSEITIFSYPSGWSRECRCVEWVMREWICGAIPEVRAFHTDTRVKPIPIYT